jgi:hypothetical protein
MRYQKLGVTGRKSKRPDDTRGRQGWRLWSQRIWEEDHIYSPARYVANQRIAMSGALSTTYVEYVHFAGVDVFPGSDISRKQSVNIPLPWRAW